MVGSVYSGGEVMLVVGSNHTFDTLQLLGD